MSVLTWNCRSVHQAHKWKFLRAQITRLRPQIVLLQETRLHVDRHPSDVGSLRAKCRAIAYTLRLGSAIAEDGRASQGGVAILFRDEDVEVLGDPVHSGPYYLQFQVRIGDTVGHVASVHVTPAALSGLEAEVVQGTPWVAMGGDWNWDAVRHSGLNRRARIFYEKHSPITHGQDTLTSPTGAPSSYDTITVTTGAVPDLQDVIFTPVSDHAAVFFSTQQIPQPAKRMRRSIVNSPEFKQAMRELAVEPVHDLESLHRSMWRLHSKCLTTGWSDGPSRSAMDVFQQKVRARRGKGKPLQQVIDPDTQEFVDTPTSLRLLYSHFMNLFTSRPSVDGLSLLPAQWKGVALGMSDLRPEHEIPFFQWCAKLGDTAPGRDGVTFAALREMMTPESSLIQLFRRIVSGDVKLKRQTCRGILFVLSKPPKLPVPTGVRGITLLPCTVKMFSGYLLKTVFQPMKGVLRDSQNGFRPGRSLQGNVLWLHSRYRWVVEKRKPRGFLLVDFRKAFDSISHAFVEEFLEFLGFTAPVIEAVLALLSGPLSVRLGTDWSEDIAVAQGVKQGDTLSPYIFILILEAHLRLVYAWLGVHDLPGKEYADDCILELTSARTGRRVAAAMQRAGAVTGLVLETGKCEFLVAPGTSATGCMVDLAYPFQPVERVKYLGSYVGVKAEEASRIGYRKKICASLTAIRHAAPGPLDLIRGFATMALPHAQQHALLYGWLPADETWWRRRWTALHRGGRWNFSYTEWFELGKMSGWPALPDVPSSCLGVMQRAMEGADEWTRKFLEDQLLQISNKWGLTSLPFQTSGRLPLPPEWWATRLWRTSDQVTTRHPPHVAIALAGTDLNLKGTVCLRWVAREQPPRMPVVGATTRWSKLRPWMIGDRRQQLIEGRWPWRIPQPVRTRFKVAEARYLGGRSWPEDVKLFTLKFLSRTLLVGDEARRHLGQPGLCALCGNIQTATHVAHTCKFTKILFRLGAEYLPRRRRDPPLSHVCFSRLEGPPLRTEVGWAIAFAAWRAHSYLVDTAGATVLPAIRRTLRHSVRHVAFLMRAAGRRVAAGVMQEIAARLVAEISPQGIMTEWLASRVDERSYATNTVQAWVPGWGSRPSVWTSARPLTSTEWWGRWLALGRPP